MLRHYWREKIEHIISNVVLFDDIDVYNIRIFKNEKGFIFVIIEEMDEDIYYDKTYSIIYYDEEKKQFICDGYDIEESKIDKDYLKDFKDYIYNINL